MSVNYNTEDLEHRRKGKAGRKDRGRSRKRWDGKCNGSC